MISHQISNSSNTYRKKRGLVNLGGQILHWLFGTLDSNDAKYYTETINSLLDDNKRINVLMRKQISIISSTITNFYDSVRKRNDDAYFLNRILQTLDKFMTQTTDKERRLDHEIQIIEHILTVSEITNGIQTVLKNYLNNAILLSHGIISFDIIHLQNLQIELEKIQTKFTLPLSPTLENT